MLIQITKLSKHYFFFDNDRMPVAVFLTNTLDEAKYLFGRLYREPWMKSVARGIYVLMEEEVQASEWDRIHDENVKRAAAKRRELEKAQVVLKPTPKPVDPKLLFSRCADDRQQCSGLMTERYLKK